MTESAPRLLSFALLRNGSIPKPDGADEAAAMADDFFFKLDQARTPTNGIASIFSLGNGASPQQLPLLSPAMGLVHQPSLPGADHTHGLFLDPDFGHDADAKAAHQALFQSMEILEDPGSLDHLFPNLHDLESQLESLLARNNPEGLETDVPSSLLDPQGGFSASMPLPSGAGGAMGLMSLSATHPGHPAGAFTFAFSPGYGSAGVNRKYRRSAPGGPELGLGSSGHLLVKHEMMGLDGTPSAHEAARRSLRAVRRTSYRDLNEGIPSPRLYGSSCSSARFSSEYGRPSAEGEDDGSLILEDEFEDDDEYGKKRKNRRRTSPMPKRRWSPMPVKSSRSPAPEPEGLELIPVHPDKAAGATSRFKGVSRHRLTGKWEACLWACRRQLYLGGFEGEVVAARAYDLAAIIFKGPGAKLNFPVEQYDEAELGPLRGLTEDQVIAHLRANPPAARLN